MKIKHIKIFKEKINKYIIRGRLNRINNIFTHLSIDEKVSIYRIARQINKKNIICVEIGSFLGASSCIIASAISKKGKLYCIDTWGNDNMNYGEEENDKLLPVEPFNDFIKNTKQYNKKIIKIRKWSHEAIGELREYTNHIDLLFIDGDHNYDGISKDWELYSPLLQKESVVIFHDSGWAEGVIRVIKENLMRDYDSVLYHPNMSVFKKVN